jgi:hypothetical protein
VQAGPVRAHDGHPMSDTADTKPIETAPREHQRDMRQPCRVATAESNLKGECLRCKSKPGERCLME